MEYKEFNNITHRLVAILDSYLPSHKKLRILPKCNFFLHFAPKKEDFICLSENNLGGGGGGLIVTFGN